MTDPNEQTNTTATQEPPEAPVTSQEPPEAPEQAQEVPGGEADADPRLAAVRREAAGYRTKLREAEAERDRLAGVVEGLRRGEVERAVVGTDGLAEAGDLWRAGVQLGDLLAEDGTVDAERVRAARDRVLAEHPHWRHHEPPNFDGGIRAGSMPGGPSFGEALKQGVGGRR